MALRWVVPRLIEQEKLRVKKAFREKPNPVKLKKEMEKIQERLWRLKIAKKKCTNFRIDSNMKQ